MYIQLPPKVQSLKKSLIGREEVPRLLRDNAFAFGSGAVHEAAGKNEHWGKKAEKITEEERVPERVPKRPEGAVKPEFHTVA